MPDDILTMTAWYYTPFDHIYLMTLGTKKTLLHNLRQYKNIAYNITAKVIHLVIMNIAQDCEYISTRSS